MLGHGLKVTLQSLMLAAYSSLLITGNSVYLKNNPPFLLFFKSTISSIYLFFSFLPSLNLKTDFQLLWLVCTKSDSYSSDWTY